MSCLGCLGGKILKKNCRGFVFWGLFFFFEIFQDIQDTYICSPPPPGTHLFCVGHSPKFEKMSEIWHGLEF